MMSYSSSIDMLKKIRDKYHNDITIRFKTFKQYKEFMLKYSQEEKNSITIEKLKHLLKLK